MSALPEDLQAIFMRIDVLERQNRKLKRIAVAGLLALTTAVLVGALSAGGQQKREKQQAPAARSKRKAAAPQLDEVQHPVFGTLKFPHAMPDEERNRAIERMERQAGIPLECSVSEARSGDQVVYRATSSLPRRGP